MNGKAKPEQWTSERCFITELINDVHWPDVSLARCRVEPGVTTQLHKLSVHEVYVIEKGNGLMSVGDSAPFIIGPGDTVSISKHTPQCVQNTGDGDLVFLCVCTPRFSHKCYTSLE
jgi:mannose-6-phosphate isomerase-like protein (cupin superfamily)